ncbi:hypothetical protein QUA56_17880 [Microcoleus sp. N3A4]
MPDKRWSRKFLDLNPYVSRIAIAISFGADKPKPQQAKSPVEINGRGA